MKEFLFIVFGILLLVIIRLENLLFICGHKFIKYLLFCSMELMLNCFLFGVCLFIVLIELKLNYFELPRGEFLNSNFLLDYFILFRNRIKCVDFICLLIFIFSDLIVSVSFIIVDLLFMLKLIDSYYAP